MDSGPAPIIISASSSSSGQAQAPYNPSVPNYERYLRALTPLLELEHKLMLQLSDPEENDEHEPTRLPGYAAGQGPSHTNSSGRSGSAPNGHTPSRSNGSAGAGSLPRIVIPPGSRSLPTSPVSPGSDEVSVPASSPWKKPFALIKIQDKGRMGEHGGELRGWWEDPDDPVHLLNRAAPVITQLWRDPKVRQKLAERRLRLEESSGL